MHVRAFYRDRQKYRTPEGFFVLRHRRGNTRARRVNNAERVENSTRAHGFEQANSVSAFTYIIMTCVCNSATVVVRGAVQIGKTPTTIGAQKTNSQHSTLHTAICENSTSRPWATF